MKSSQILKVFVFVTVFLTLQKARAQQPENWTGQQLIEPSELVDTLNSGKDLPVIISVGPGAPIPNSVETGTTKEKDNLDTLKNKLSGLAKDRKIVIYCGCCPFDHCPNVRPAIALLKDMKFTNYKLLDLPHNIKTDWIDKGYPVMK